MQPFILSIETHEGHAFRHSYHLGTIERVARQIAEEMFRARVKAGMPIVTVALIRDGRVFDTFMGDQWTNDL